MKERAAVKDWTQSKTRDKKTLVHLISLFQLACSGQPMISRRASIEPQPPRRSLASTALLETRPMPAVKVSAAVPNRGTSTTLYILHYNLHQVKSQVGAPSWCSAHSSLLNSLSRALAHPCPSPTVQACLSTLYGRPRSLPHQAPPAATHTPQSALWPLSVPVK